MQIHVFNMGETKYGDCVLVSHGGKNILIDGGHPGDTALIVEQLEEALGQSAPFTIHLLVVTHCHQDHIGCLPRLVSDGTIKVKKALVADEKLGWGRTQDNLSPIDALPLTEPQKRLVGLLQEEDLSDLPTDELEALLEDVTLEEKYGNMLQDLIDAGATVVRYRSDTQPEVASLLAGFSSLGLELLGPTEQHLLECWEAIANGTDAIAKKVLADVRPDDDAAGLAAAYRRLLRNAADDPAFAADQPGVGAAKNDQSIVLKVEVDGWSAMLAGDMQFAKAEVPNLPPLMTALRSKIAAAGPYDFIKLTHHTSYNALDDGVLDEWLQSTSTQLILAHTGGSNDSHHPEKSALEALEARESEIIFVRNDRNKMITIEKSGGEIQASISVGDFNDFSLNAENDPEPLFAEEEEQRSARPPAKGGGPGAVVQRRDRGDVVHVTADVPHAHTKVTITIEVEPRSAAEKKKGESESGEEVTVSPPLITDIRPATGRSLRGLLFVTSQEKLVLNLGREEAAAVIASIEVSPATLLNLPVSLTNAKDAARQVRAKVASMGAKGVVILGGYDVVPADRLDAIDAATREAIAKAGQEGQDSDDFIIWSDDLYGDSDGDFLPEIPVSRIPDGRSPLVVRGALEAPLFAPSGRFAIRNLHREFAAGPYDHVAGAGGRLEISAAFDPASVNADDARGAVYFMLHGSDRDATRFWGETRGGAAFEAFNVENIPDVATGSVIFTGCCWGALTSLPSASRFRPGAPIRPRVPEGSIALSYLKSGAVAFVGCTGSHYSPLLSPYNYFGGPMHVAFWRQIKSGVPPALALFNAKKEYVSGMPHGRTDPFSRAVEMKILRQFTCLGLGW